MEPRITRNKLTKPLRVHFSEEEKAERHEELLKALNKQASLEAEKAVFNETIKGKLKPVLADIERGRQALNSGYDVRQADCEEVFNFEGEPMRLIYNEGQIDAYAVRLAPNTVSLIRLDTLEIIEERPISDKERQTSFLGAEQDQDDDEPTACQYPDLRFDHCLPCGEATSTENPCTHGCCWGCEHQAEVPEGHNQAVQPEHCRNAPPAPAPGEDQGQEAA